MVPTATDEAPIRLARASFVATPFVSRHTSISICIFVLYLAQTRIHSPFPFTAWSTAASASAGASDACPISTAEIGRLLDLR